MCLKVDVLVRTTRMQIMEVRIRAGSKYIGLMNLVIIYFGILEIIMAYGGGSYVAVMAGSLVLTGFVFLKLNRTTQKKFMFVVAFSLLLWLTESFLYRYRGTRLPIFAPSILMYIYTGLLLGFVIVYYPIKLRWLMILMYAFLIWCFFMVVFLQTPIDEVFSSETSSGVGLLSLTMSLILPVTYLEYRDHHTISILPFFLQMIISFFVESRTGLGVCVMQFCFAIFSGIYKMKSKALMIWTFLSVGVIMLVGFYFVSSSSSDMGGVSKMVEMGGDLTGRDLIWANYFYNFDVDNLVYGRDIIGINDGEWQNAHCSWIQLHSSIGVLGIIMMIVFILVLVYYLFKDLPLGLIFLSLVVYASFNYIFFFNLTDKLIYIFIFNYLLVRKANHTLRIQPFRMKLL